MAEDSTDSDASDPVSQQGVEPRQRRELVVECLASFDGPISLADLADEVAVTEFDAPITGISPESVRDIYLSLYHRHIPKLAENDILEYDQERDVVRLFDDEDAGRDRRNE